MSNKWEWFEPYQSSLLDTAPMWVQGRLLTLQVGGSHAYGLATETSDYDFRGICVPPFEYYLNPYQGFEQYEKHHPDCVVFSITKFFKLAADCNPNIIEMLFVNEDPEESIVTHPGKCLRYRDVVGLELSFAWLDVLRHRDWFVSQKAAHTFTGYAMAQLKRIKTHRKWLLDPKDVKPERKDFSLPEEKLISMDIMGAIEATADHGQFSAEVMDAYRRERAYHNALREYQQHENWKKTHNPARAALEEKSGYDTKHAMHLVRLMRMGAEILEGKGVIVHRPDRDELLSIRRGDWDYDELIRWASEMDARIKNELLPKSSLPYSANRESLGSLHQEILLRIHHASEA